MIKYLFLFIVAVEIGNKLLLKKLVGIVALKRDNRTIGTTLSVVTLIRYLVKGNKEEFKKDCKKFFSSLEKGVEYYTHTHSIFLKEIKKRCGRENISYTKTKKKRMVLAKLYIGNIENLFDKYQYYDITFTIK